MKPNSNHDSQIVMMTKGEMNSLYNRIDELSAKVLAFEYLHNKFELPENYKDKLTSPEASIPLKLAKKDTFDVVLDKLSKQTLKALKTRN